jgi:Pyruvate/2-oxoacid:ferredoxin oxidoreductase delta subunit
MECSVGHLQSKIEENIDLANSSLNEKLQIEKVVNSEPVQSGVEKREIFSRLVDRFQQSITVSDKEQLEIENLLQRSSLEKRLYPIKQKLIIELLKREENSKDLLSNHIYSRKIEKEKCTNCGDCVQFCPTDALFTSSDKLSIFINSSRCIDCNNCNIICKTDAIESVSGDVETVLVNRSDRLVEFTMRTCTECKMPFIDRGEEICDRCVDFKRDFDHMFTLAKDL